MGDCWGGRAHWALAVAKGWESSRDLVRGGYLEWVGAKRPLGIGATTWVTLRLNLDLPSSGVEESCLQQRLLPRVHPGLSLASVHHALGGGQGGVMAWHTGRWNLTVGNWIEFGMLQDRRKYLKQN